MKDPIKIKKKKHLEMILERIPKHPNPKVDLEQYSTPSIICADLLWNAYNLGDIYDKTILDLGCGTGILSFASCLMGAKYSLGIDIDEESVDLAIKTSQNNDIFKKYSPNINSDFLVSDINKYDNIFDLLYFNNIKKSNDLFKFDTVIQNPPFGSQERSKHHTDRKFMEFAVNSANVVYSFHMASTEEFVIKFYEDLGADVTHKLIYNFPIPKIYDFHTEDLKNVKVIVLRVDNSID